MHPTGPAVQRHALGPGLPINRGLPTPAVSGNIAFCRAHAPDNEPNSSSRKPIKLPDLGWMVHADTVLADEAIVMAAYEALAKRRRLSRTRGRRGFSAEVVVRFLVPHLSQVHPRRHGQDGR